MVAVVVDNIGNHTAARSATVPGDVAVVDDYFVVVVVDAVVAESTDWAAMRPLRRAP